jgi:hypothetical protein
MGRSKPTRPQVPDRCPICHCSENDPCLVHGVPCCWVTHVDGVMCSSCAPVEYTAAEESGRCWLEVVIYHARSDNHPRFTPCQSHQREEAQHVKERKGKL